MTRLLSRPLLAMLVLLPIAAALCLAAPPPQQPKGNAAASDPPIIDLQGFQDILARHRGKPLLVYFWATWCEPCRDEYPMLVQLARQYAGQELAVAGISLDEDGEISLVRRFLQRNNPVFPNYRKRRDNEEAFNKSVDPKWSGAIPATFLYSRDGRLQARLIGGHSREEFEKVIRQLLQAAPAR